MKKILWAWLCILPLALAGCGSDTKEQAQRPAPVRVAPVVQEDVPYTLLAVGTVRAAASVEVRARVTGEIVQVLFEEGTDVQEGQDLLLIDPQPYEAVLREARAKLAQEEARLTKAKRDKNRYAKLVQDGYVSHDTYEQASTAAATDDAAVRAASAAVDKAALDVAYCTITAPISGRAGELTLQKGNMVKTTETAMLRINAISPCYVHFTVPERYLTDVRKRMQDAGLTVTATPRDGIPETGTVTLLDNSVDTATGTIRLRATFPNVEHTLWPGQFVEIKLLLGTENNVLTVPEKALMDGRDTRYVYVITEGKAVYRKVETGFSSGGKVVVTSGLQAGEYVVTDGQMRLTAGMPVDIQQDKQPLVKE